VALHNVGFLLLALLRLQASGSRCRAGHPRTGRWRPLWHSAPAGSRHDLRACAPASRIAGVAISADRQVQPQSRPGLPSSTINVLVFGGSTESSGATLGWRATLGVANKFSSVCRLPFSQRSRSWADHLFIQQRPRGCSRSRAGRGGVKHERPFRDPARSFARPSRVRLEGFAILVPLLNLALGKLAPSTSRAILARFGK